MLLTVTYSDPHQSPQRRQEIEQIVGHGAYRREWRDGRTTMEFGCDDAQFKCKLLEIESPWPVSTSVQSDAA
jgi:hypothetical protein